LDADLPRRVVGLTGLRARPYVVVLDPRHDGCAVDRGDVRRVRVQANPPVERRADLLPPGAVRLWAADEDLRPGPGHVAVVGDVRPAADAGDRGLALGPAGVPVVDVQLRRDRRPRAGTRVVRLDVDRPARRPRDVRPVADAGQARLEALRHAVADRQV